MRTHIKSRWLRILTRIVICTAIVLVIVRIMLPGAAVKIANKVLPDILNADASIGNIDLSLLRGRLVIEDIRIAQPKGFDGDELLTVDRVSADVWVRSALGGRIIVQSILVESPTVRLIRNTNGTANIEALAPESTTNKVAETEGQPGKPAGPPPPVVLQTLRVNGLRVEYEDFSFGDAPIKVAIADFDLEINNVEFDPSSSDDTRLPGHVLVTADIEQPPPFNNAKLGLIARLGVLTTNVPAVNAAVRIFGLELKTFASAIPPGVARALGGDNLDVTADLKMAADVLDFDVEVETSGARLPLLHIGGTPREPKLDVGGALLTVAKRFGGSLGNLVGSVGGVGLEAADAAVGTALTAGKGAAKVVGSVGSGIFKVVKGAATGDLSAVGNGLKQSTVGSVTKAIGTVADTATTAVDGVANTAASSVVNEAAAKWRKGTPMRWNTAWAFSLTNVPALPYPRPEAEPPQVTSLSATNALKSVTPTNGAPVKTKPTLLIQTDIDE